ncbi:Hsp20/alpha crystallin family protein [Gynurincola endophyticus]|jgi:HSP20 family protein|uniref:Hsp20/alpha crystallin family protein n=1 Tax=Gynurincola endophyticus TaxID=2479004 RepID=UPI000F8CF192|nr:Hsp20/alpha crystallin family protein [Gynurincola endophyticus]
MTLVKMNNRPFNRHFSDLFDELFNMQTVEQNKIPAVNISETDQAFQLQLFAPGLKKELFTIKVEDGNLNIGYEHKSEQKTENNKVVRNEFSYKSFKRSFHIADLVDADQISAQYQDGVLTLNLPKTQPVQPAIKQIAIQ